ncbi:MAG: OmpA family protein, partial [Pyrinomonadaceae bacterium]
SRIRTYLTGVGTSSGLAAETFDRVDASAGTTDLSDDAAAAGVPGIFSDDDGGNKSPLSWLLPLLLLGLLVILGFWFCGKSAPVATTNANINKGNVVTNTNATAKMADSSFRIEAKDGKYTVSGVVPDQATLDKIKTALTAQYGAGNVDFAGLKIDANAKPFAADWWTNFEKMLPNLKDWKTGTLAFAGNAITEAMSLPAAAAAQLKSLFSDWTMPTVSTDSAADENRKLTEVALPDGTKLQAYPNGIEDQLIKFIESDEYKKGTADSLKEKWFNFDDLNFKFDSTELVPESKRQLDNIVAILKAFPDAKIKIGGYTDKKGDDAANKKLSDNRAKAVKDALNKAGVGAQVPEAEGYGEEFAKVPETASDEERQVDRKTSVRLIK